MIWTVPILFGLGCAAALRLAAHSRNDDAKHLAWGLVAVWACANLAWYINAMWLIPAVDWLFGMVAVVAWKVSGDRWLALLVQFTAVRLILHVLDALTGHAFLVPYIHGLNLMFTLQLLAVSYEGWADGIPLFSGFRRLRVFLRSERAQETR